MKEAQKLSCPHLLSSIALSILLLCAGAWLVLGIWYPRPYWGPTNIMEVGRYAVLIHVGISALMYLPWRRRSSDGVSDGADFIAIDYLLACSALLSLSFLASGRPVALVFSVDRVVLVRANEIRTSELALPDVSPLAIRWSGSIPFLAARLSNDSERFESIQLALAGYDLPHRPSRWVHINTQSRDVLRVAKPNVRAGDANLACESTALQSGALPFYLELHAAKEGWVMLLSGDLQRYCPAPHPFIGSE